MNRAALFTLASLLPALFCRSQIPLHDLEVDYAHPKEYVIAGIRVDGVQYLDMRMLIVLSGLSEGDRIEVPGDAISNAIRKLWEQGLFSDIRVSASNIVGERIWLVITLQERPRLSSFRFDGVTRSEANDLREKLELIRGETVTENLLITARTKIRNHFVAKGRIFTETDILQEKDTAGQNAVSLNIKVSKGPKVKVNAIVFHGNEKLSDKKLRHAMKEVKEKNFFHIFKISKYTETDFETDRKNIIAQYLESGYRDARILKDTLYRHHAKTVNVEITVSEGNTYYFRDITWLGNTKYTTQQLNEILGVHKGDPYNEARLEKNLFMNPSGRDVSSLYLDNGYLFFQVNPVEKLVEGDSIDIELRIYEGKQATISRISVSGNTKTNDHVILRELRTKPGQLFSRSDIIRSQRELAQLGYFDPEGFDVVTAPHPEKGTVDIEYVVVERPSDQVELSGGWGGGIVVGTLGLVFSNFSAKNIFTKGTYQPLPAGDGQRLTLRATSNGPVFQSYNMSFTEPWLGGKKPNSFSFSIYQTTRTNGRKKSDELRESLRITGLSAGYGIRLKWPDDYFSLYTQASYQLYRLDNFNSGGFIFGDGRSHNLGLTTTLSRSDIDNPIYPAKGSKLSLSVQAAPPFSIFSGRDYSTLEPAEKYKWIEYHKWKFHAAWFAPLDKWPKSKFVLVTKVGFGFLGFYNPDIGTSPFERYYMGGDGLSGFSLDGRELIAMRGYENNSITPGFPNEVGAAHAAKYTAELRFALSKNPNATVFLLAFGEAGNTWSTFRDFDPFRLKRSAGFGVRLFLPMFGLLGVDWGYPFDDPDGLPGFYTNVPGMGRGQFHFMIGQFINQWNSD